MRSSLLFLLVVSLISVSFCWTLVWEEHFNGNSVDQSKWNLRNYFTHGPEGEIYLSDECYVSNGYLVLRSQQREVNGHKWTSCWLDTREKFAQQFGRWEIYAKLPAGKGMWPAHWLMPNDNSCWPTEGEIDIMEYLGNDPSKPLGPIYGTLHWSKDLVCSSNLASGGVYPANGVDFTRGFHQYAIEWYPEGITWFVDNHPYHTVNRTQFTPVHPFYLILNSAVGGSWPGFPDAETVFPQYHYVDYVRVWK
eukprot:TRINITY_DN5080_c0_g1_i1.p1 TRINITY_DN5080_c0_g1~~TRINITY_DN5080_c0_g1_i1.p1  ORF type:complete len:250 (+),score=40.73 TRINITY_DN5080_c0_g1_i1:41-790(+)